MRWFYFAVGAVMLALTIWTASRALTQHDPARRAGARKGLVLCVPYACLCITIGIHPTLNFVVRGSAGSMIIWGVWILLLTVPGVIFGSMESFRDTRQYPMFLRALTCAKWSAAFTFIGLGLTVLILWSFPDTVFYSALFGVMAVGGLVTCGTFLVAASIVGRFRIDAEMEAWRQGHPTR